VNRYATITPIPKLRSVDLLTYELPADDPSGVAVGMRAVVPLGRRRVTGLVVGLSGERPEGISTKPILSVLDSEPVVPEDLLQLARWMSEYYLVPLADVISLAVGKGLTTASSRRVRLVDAAAARTGVERRVVAALTEAARHLDIKQLKKRVGAASIERSLTALQARGAIEIADTLAPPPVKAKFETVVRIKESPDEHLAAAIFNRAPRRRELFEYLDSLPSKRAHLSQLAALFPRPTTQLEFLRNAGVVELLHDESYRGNVTGDEADVTVELTVDQNNAVEAVSACLGSYQPFLLHGITSSGKTEVYARLIKAALDEGRSALVLVPEIPLTHQIVARLVARFGPTVAVLHSELTAGERWDQWRRLARGEARIAVGARSAVLAPLSNLGLICVDEEHDAAYKQDDSVRYNGRDVAVVRAKQRDCPLVLGSATPSMESWHKAQTGQYRLLTLPSRISERPLPSVEVVDLRGRDIVATGGLSEHLVRLMRKNLESAGQTLLFLNRRGFARSLLCYRCGAAIECRSCSVSLTLHLGEKRLRCHHCDALEPLPTRCPACGSDALVSQGLGTQRVEETVRSLLPGARVARLDRDITSRAGRSKQVLDAWRKGELDILIGTQMVAKGHDVPGVTLVGIIEADLSLNMPDFRGGERTFQLVSQVAGRAGRGARKGRVVLQTYQVDHYAVAAAVRHDYEGFAATELSARNELGYPPFSRMVILRFESANVAAAERLAANAAQIASRYAQRYGPLTVRGPAPAVVERVRGRHRRLLQLRSTQSAPVRGAANAVAKALAEQARRSATRMIVDVDPLEVI
jgi:primosomal protein N' (replication factor Y)